MARKRWVVGGLVCLGVLFILAFLPCLQTIRATEGSSRSANNLKQIGAALRSYHEVYERLPPAVICDKDGRPLYSWRVAILPFIEMDRLYKQFHLDEPWDSPHNFPLSQTRVHCYYSPFDTSDNPGLTRYQVLIGPGTAFEKPGLTFDDFPDGLGNTILVVAAADAVPWAMPGDVAYHPDQPLPKFGAGHTRPVKVWCHELWRYPGFGACFADGESRFIRSSTEESIIRALISRNGGEEVNVGRFR